MEIPGVSLKTLMAFLEYLYTDHCSMDEDVMAILILANQYCVNRLKALCELHISKMVEEATKENALVTDFSVIGKYAVVTVTMVTGICFSQTYYSLLRYTTAIS